MITFFQQLLDFLARDRIHLFMIFFVVVWANFGTRIGPAFFYRPIYVDPVEVARKIHSSIIIPVVAEEPSAFLHGVLDTIIANVQYRRDLVGKWVDEIIVVMNGDLTPEMQAIEAVCRRRVGQVPMRVFYQKLAGKRGAIIDGEWNARYEYLVLADSDSHWDPPRKGTPNHGTLTHLLMPFAHPKLGRKVGGVTTSQGIRARTMDIKHLFADWMEDVRRIGTMPSMSFFRAVGCLPGRVIAVRRIPIVSENRRRFVHEKNLGTHKEESDDRTLTNYAIKMGYYTLFQSTAVVMTDAPSEWRNYWKQQIRWSRGSQYNNWRMMLTYLNIFKRPRGKLYVGFIYALDTIIPFWWLGTIVNMIWKIIVGDPIRYTNVTGIQQIGLVILSVLISAFVRNLGHFKNYREDIKWLPAYVVILSAFLTPIRVIGFFVMARSASWGTRGKTGYKEPPKINLWSWLPVIVGTVILDFFALAGPFLETPRQLSAVIHQHTGWFVLALASPFLLFGPLLMLWDAVRISRLKRRNARILHLWREENIRREAKKEPLLPNPTAKPVYQKALMVAASPFYYPTA